MNKKEFLHILEMSLSDFKDEDKKEILYDYEEHFRIGEESGKSEEELIKELGDPNNIANQYRTSNKQENNDGSKNKTEEDNPIIVPIIATCGLLFFNLIFILGPYLGIAASILALFVSAIAVIIAGIGTILVTILSPFFPLYIGVPNGISILGIILLGIGVTALGLLFLIGMCYVCKYFYKGTVKYINWNLTIIKGR
ncbi:HAAS signaling domain-containing protein [Clostridium akagii]|uniref:HAAS signaling domain-containing protein n=1 Tax=Clostridium akagii TaxID=91623 RepID=UPI00047DBEAA|nr:DUF1700 domain-containing protein [Clostridium akagii]